MAKLTTISNITGLPILTAAKESCGESSCEEFCEEYLEKGCVGCPVQEAIARIYHYENTGQSHTKAQRKYNTHIVIKKEDAKKYLSENEYKMLDSLHRIIELHRFSTGRNTSYYVCNTDEPYADKVLQVILEGEDEKRLK